MTTATLAECHLMKTIEKRGVFLSSKIVITKIKPTADNAIWFGWGVNRSSGQWELGVINDSRNGKMKNKYIFFSLAKKTPT